MPADPLIVSPSNDPVTSEQIEELERVIAHLEGRIQGHEIGRKRRVEILRAIIERLKGESQ